MSGVKGSSKPPVDLNSGPIDLDWVKGQFKRIEASRARAMRAAATSTDPTTRARYNRLIQELGLRSQVNEARMDARYRSIGRWDLATVPDDECKAIDDTPYALMEFNPTFVNNSKSRAKKRASEGNHEFIQHKSVKRRPKLGTEPKSGGKSSHNSVPPPPPLNDRPTFPPVPTSKHRRTE